MWSAIRKDQYLKFLNDYPQLAEFGTQIILGSNGMFHFLPKFIYETFPHPGLVKLQDPEFNYITYPNLKFTGELRPDQFGMVAPFEQMFRLSGRLHGCLKARPGAGKTVMGTYFGCLSKYATLIIINNTVLHSQWVNAIKTFTNCPEENIGLIQGNTFKTENCPFVIGMVQTFLSRIKNDMETGSNEFYNKVRNCGFNLVLYDECHHTTSGIKYSTSTLALNTNNLVGLSATPFVTGLHEILMNNTVGNVISDTSNYELKPKVVLLKFNSGLTEKYGKAMLRMPDMLKQRAKYNSFITTSPQYIELICKLNQHILKDGHRLLNIFFTKKQVGIISKSLSDLNIPNIQFFSEQRALDKSLDKNLVATYHFAGEGFDYAQLSALLLAVPLSGRKSLTQVIGRILREHDNKRPPLVIILIDMAFSFVFGKDIPRIRNIIQTEFSCDVEELNAHEYFDKYVK